MFDILGNGQNRTMGIERAYTYRTPLHSRKETEHRRYNSSREKARIDGHCKPQQ